MQLQAEHISDMEHLNRLRARKVLRCAIYIRVSTAEQRIEGWSLQAQEAGLRKTAEAKGWKVVGVYADEGKTARKRLKDRKQIHRLMEDVQAGLIDVIIFKELDRWFRNVSDFYKIQDVLDACGVEWFSQQQPSLEMRTKEGRLQTNVLLSVGQNETDAGSDRIKYTQKHLRSLKRWTSGAQHLPKCYTLDENQHVIIDPVHEPYARMVIDELHKTSSFQAAMKRANEAYPDSAMFYNNIVRMVRNPMLYGEYKEVPDFVEKPFMTREEWELIQAKTTRSARYNPRQFYIFSSLIRCPECGCTMNGTASYKNIKDGTRRAYKYYTCPYAKIQGRCSNKFNVREEYLEPQLLEYVKASVEEMIAKVEQIEHEQKKKPKKKNNRAAIEKQLERLENVYIDSLTMTEEKYEQKKAAILAKLVDEEEPVEKLPELVDLEKVKALFEGNVLEVYESFTAEERREFWRNILTEIRIYDKKIVSIEFLK